MKLANLWSFYGFSARLHGRLIQMVNGRATPCLTRRPRRDVLRPRLASNVRRQNETCRSPQLYSLLERYAVCTTDTWDLSSAGISSMSRSANHPVSAFFSRAWLGPWGVAMISLKRANESVAEETGCS